MMYQDPREDRCIAMGPNEEPAEACCSEMVFHIVQKERIIKYEGTRRHYSLRTKRQNSPGITNCPFCGTKLPERLDKEYQAELKKFGITKKIKNIEEEVLHNPSIPEEFKSEQWWKKLGL